MEVMKFIKNIIMYSESIPNQKINVEVIREKVINNAS